jgi:hypothetical protein
MKERIDGSYNNEKADFKIAYSPRRIYLKQEYPNPGLEVLYIEGMYDNKALVNRNAFPWTTLKLNPTGNTMRNGQHHSIFKSGFTFFIDVLEHLRTKYDSEVSKMVQYEGLVKFAGVVCHKIIVNNPHFSYNMYKVVANENLETLSNKFKVCDYMILENNPGLKSYDDLNPGMYIKVPVDYARQFILYIDPKKKLPVGIKIYDEKGLFEEYTYLDILTNPVFSLLDFERNNPAYGFH